MVPFSHGIMAFASVPFYRNVLFVPQTYDVQFTKTVNPLIPTLTSTPSRYPEANYPFSDIFKESYSNIEPVSSLNMPNIPGWLLSPKITYGPAYASSRLEQYRSFEDENPETNNGDFKNEIKPNNTNVSKPSIVPLPDDVFNSLQDAKALFRSMKGFKIDTMKIISILTKRSSEQRAQIASRFVHFYDMDLRDAVRSKTKGKFRDLLLALLTPIPQLYARELHLAMTRAGTDEETLIEILCTLTNDEIQMVKQMYYSNYRKHLEDDIRKETTGNFQKLLLALCSVNRSEDPKVNVKKAIQQAKQLIEAGEMRMETEERAFISVFCSQSYNQLTEIFSQYQSMTGQKIEDTIKNEFIGVIKKSLRTIAKAVRSKPAFFAECLYKSMSGLGTNSRQMVRVMVTRSEIDLGDIEDLFFEQYHYSLENWIEEDFHGNFKKGLLAILGAV